MGGTVVVSRLMPMPKSAPAATAPRRRRRPANAARTSGRCVRRRLDNRAGQQIGRQGRCERARDGQVEALHVGARHHRDAAYDSRSGSATGAIWYMPTGTKSMPMPAVIPARASPSRCRRRRYSCGCMLAVVSRRLVDTADLAARGQRGIEVTLAPINVSPVSNVYAVPGGAGARCRSRQRRCAGTGHRRRVR